VLAVKERFSQKAKLRPVEERTIFSLYASCLFKWPDPTKEYPKNKKPGDFAATGSIH